MNKKSILKISNLAFTDAENIKDLQTMLRRLEMVAEQEVVLMQNGGVLSVYGCTQSSGGLLSDSPTILVHRAYQIAGSLDGGSANATVPLRSILDRIAHLKEGELSFNAPESSIFVSWGGQMPERSGWQKVGEISAASLRTVAEQGMKRVADLMPEDAGGPVVDRVRRSVWDLKIALNIPAGAAFALETMGFLENSDSVRVYKKSQWTRLSTAHGDVLIK